MPENWKPKTYMPFNFCRHPALAYALGCPTETATKLFTNSGCANAKHQPKTAPTSCPRIWIGVSIFWSFNNSIISAMTKSVLYCFFLAGIGESPNPRISGAMT